MSGTATLLTAEAYARLADREEPSELVRGRIVTINPPSSRHGQVCAQVVYLLRRFSDEHRLGHVLSNDSGVVTQREPDTVRGADVAFYSYTSVPRGPLPAGYLSVPPEVIFEVLSPEDRWSQVLLKVGEYLAVGASAVCVLDPEMETAHLYYADRPDCVLSANDVLALPKPLENIRLEVRYFLE